MADREIMWTGDPICYKREKGSALIVGRYQYLFDTEGRTTSQQPITRPVLAVRLQHMYKDKALAMAAYMKVVQEPKLYTEEEMQTKLEEHAQEKPTPKTVPLSEPVPD